MKMKVTDGGEIGEICEIRLSRRNLKALLAKLDGKPVGSAKQLEKYFKPGTIDPDVITPVLLRVVAEENEGHYEGKKPGPMHPETEEAIK